jgi:hypothetical protein
MLPCRPTFTTHICHDICASELRVRSAARPVPAALGPRALRPWAGWGCRASATTGLPVRTVPVAWPGRGGPRLPVLATTVLVLAVATRPLALALRQHRGLGESGRAWPARRHWQWQALGRTLPRGHSGIIISPPLSSTKFDPSHGAISSKSKPRVHRLQVTAMPSSLRLPSVQRCIRRHCTVTA